MKLLVMVTLIVCSSIYSSVSNAQAINSLDMSGAPKKLSVLDRLQGKANPSGTKFVLKRSLKVHELGRHGTFNGRGVQDDEVVYPLIFKSQACIGYIVTHVGVSKIRKGMKLNPGTYFLSDGQISNLDSNHAVRLTLQPSEESANKSSIAIECAMKPQDSIGILQNQIGSAFTIAP